MSDGNYWLVRGRQAPQDLFAWSTFVDQSEFLWLDVTLVRDAAAWQSLWFELEIVNGLALAEWETQGQPSDWSCHWRKVYQRDAAMLVDELLRLLMVSDCPAASVD